MLPNELKTEIVSCMFSIIVSLFEEYCFSERLKSILQKIAKYKTKTGKTL